MIGRSKAMIVIGLVAALIAGGVGIHTVSGEDQAPDDGLLAGISEIDQEEENGTAELADLSFRVGAMVERRPVPIQGAEVTVFSVQADRENDTMTIRLERAAEGVTDEEGYIHFELEKGKYLLLAKYHGLAGFAKCDLTDDQTARTLLHNHAEHCDQFRHKVARALDQMDDMTIVIEEDRIEKGAA